MENILLSPISVFGIFLLLSAFISIFSKRLAARGARAAANKETAYACGEILEENQVQPDYSEFFKFAFFFTILHVIALVVATIPGGLTIMSTVYLGVTVLALYMLLRR